MAEGLLSSYECKTAGTQYSRERNNTLEDGGQLISYFQQERSAKALYLYCSQIVQGRVEELAEFIRTATLDGTNADELHKSWGGTLEPYGIFHEAAGLYDDAFRGITKSQLKELTRETGQGVFHSFAEVLRRHVVSDKPNAFNKIFNLFLCKIADEDDKGDDDEMDFQWRFGDTGEQLLSRLGALYKRGMADYLRLDTVDRYHSSLTEFTFIDVFNKATFDANVMILREVVELLQHYRIKYSARHQYLGDFFEMLLGTGIKQEAGQFFTPVPLARAVVRAMPIGQVIQSKVAERRSDILPFVMDFACGAGHFLTEAIEEVHRISEDVDLQGLTSRARTRYQRGREAYGWASEYVFGIEKDHRLAKVTKIATFLNGDGDANIIHADGLAPFEASSGYPELLVCDDQRRLAKFDIVVANPPFSVSNFRVDVLGGAERFRLYKHLSADSGEIECLFLERAGQMLVDGGAAGIFFPLSLLGNGHAVYRGARRLLAVEFAIRGVIELREKTFIATPTTTVCIFMQRRRNQEIQSVANGLLRLTEARRNSLSEAGIDLDALREAISTLKAKTPGEVIETAYDNDVVAHAIRALADDGAESVVAFSGDSVQEQQRVLGYRFSKSRGSEGYTVLEEAGIPQTLLYDPESLTSEHRFSGAVLALMEGRGPDIPADDDEVSRFMALVPAKDLWNVDGWTIENPSAFFVTEATVESASPFGDFIEESDGDTATFGQWVETGRIALVRGATYPKSAETPRQTEWRILTATNMDLSSRRITQHQFRYLLNDVYVADEQKPKAGDIVICTASGSLKHLGKIACVDDDVDAYIGGFLMILRCENGADRKILAYNLLSLRFRQMVARAKEQNINNLTEEKLRPFRLHVPNDVDAFVQRANELESRR